MESEHDYCIPSIVSKWLSSFTNNTRNVCLILYNAQTNEMSQCAQNLVDGFFTVEAINTIW